MGFKFNVFRSLAIWNLEFQNYARNYLQYQLELRIVRLKDSWWDIRIITYKFCSGMWMMTDKKDVSLMQIVIVCLGYGGHIIDSILNDLILWLWYDLHVIQI